MTRIWSDESKLARWLDVELAALEAWAELGVVPPDDVSEIRAHVRVPTPERVAEIEQVTDHDTAAFVDALSEQLGREGRWIHFGLTSSDVVDTALSLQIQEAGALILDGVDRAVAAIVARAEEHRHTICVGRSHGIHAEPTTFGWKLAGWAFELQRARDRIVRASALVGFENVPLWHERDISNSSAERVVIPDAFLALDYMLDRFAWIVEGLVVHPERMRRNLDASHGLVFSHRLLLMLVEAGVPRDEAYRAVQRHAMQAWEEERDFRELVATDTEIASRVDLAVVFDLDATVRHVDTVFERLHALVGKEEPVHA